LTPAAYPNFAELAAGSTWFRNAYSSYDLTTKAVRNVVQVFEVTATGELRLLARV
jgi:hypothetical protein